ncbi:MAG: DNA polymerase III subunit alpha [Bacteroidetes bacterium]|nr:DNA polymerase III subunit alpha [Bacteroidota bacterium]
MLLNCHTYYSFRFGTLSEIRLLELAQQAGYTAIALTDINNTSACLNFIRKAPEYGIRPVVGIDFRNGIKQQFVGIAKNNNGFQQLNTFLSYHLHHKLPLPEEAPELEDAVFIYPFERVLALDKKQFKPNEYIGVAIRNLRKLPFSHLVHQKDKLVILHTTTFENKKDFNIHRLLRAIDHNTLLSKLSINEQALQSDAIMPFTALKASFATFPFMIKNTEALIASADIYFDFSTNKKPQNKKTYTGNLQDDNLLIRKLCDEGLKKRYATITPQIQSRLEKELNLIGQQQFVPFFLINWDIVSYAQRKGYYYVGRGSGANSIVAYLLGITDVDPIKLNLYFERFMNLYRANPPDFDIDFSWRDREDVTRYIFNQFGQQGQVVLLGAYNTFQYNAAIRELGKVFGLPNREIEVLGAGKFDYNNLDPLSQLTYRYATYLHGMPNHLSVHAGGILISEVPIQYFTATNLPPKGFATTQFDMVVAEDVGLYKYDILGQRGLGKIKEALEIIQYNRPEVPKIDIHDVQSFIEDEAVNTMISRAECIGCFYVESPAMRMLLKKLEVNNYMSLVAASSIIRPGVAKSGMMREYILRHKHPERRQQAHPVMWELMEETYGIMVYQEDVIKVAHYFAKLDLGEADVLRRGMSGKFRSRQEFKKVRNKFFENCKAEGYDCQTTDEVWHQIESFAGYAFAKGHSASYAVESYQSLYLKHYFPLEFLVAVLNNGGGFYHPELYIHEARMLGGCVHAPDINLSKYETIIKGRDIYLGFHFLNGLQNTLAQKIIAERACQGYYTSLDDFLDRVPIGIEQLDMLIRINAFKAISANKRKLLWEAHMKLNKTPTHQARLFKTSSRNFSLPELSHSAIEDTFDEIELLGFPLNNPFHLVAEKLNNILLAKEMHAYVDKTVTLYGYLIAVKSTRTSKDKRMNFGTFLDLSGDWIDTVHFPPVAARYPFRGKGIYALTGKVVSEFGFLTLEVQKMEKLAYIPDPRYAMEVAKAS